eukprot:m.310050 g.310050  ORF g.310050 m.310050 type:complete len:164 (+) comp49304_c0_seq1:120-611(+)
MNAPLVLLLTIFIGTASSLTCYLCKHQTSLSQCHAAALRNHTCERSTNPNTSVSCVEDTTLIIASGPLSYNVHCQENCTPSDNIFGEPPVQNRVVKKCCNSDFCNKPGAFVDDRPPTNATNANTPTTNATRTTNPTSGVCSLRGQLALLTLAIGLFSFLDLFV